MVKKAAVGVRSGMRNNYAINLNEFSLTLYTFSVEMLYAIIVKTNVDAHYKIATF